MHCLDTPSKKLNYELEIIKRDELHNFKILPKRWIVKRTFAWLDTNRRGSKDYERLIESSEAMTHLAASKNYVTKILNSF